MRHEFGSEWAGFKRPMVNGAKAILKFRLGKEHFPCRMEAITQPAKRLHFFFAGGASGDVEFVRNGAVVGSTQIVNGSKFDQATFQSTGDFELRFDSNALDDRQFRTARALPRSFLHRKVV